MLLCGAALGCAAEKPNPRDAADANDTGRGLYNIGIVHLAAGDQPAAVAAFDGASRANPLLAIARERANQVRYQLHAGHAGPAER